MQTTEQLALDFLALSYPKEDWTVDHNYERDEVRVGLYRPAKRIPRLSTIDGKHGRVTVIDVPAGRVQGWVAAENLSTVIRSPWKLMGDPERMIHVLELLATPRDDNAPDNSDFYEDRHVLTEDGKNLLSMVASDLIASADREEKRYMESV